MIPDLRAKLSAWLRQPTTIHGLGGLAAAVVWFALYHVTHDAAASASGAMAAFGVIAVLIKDNTGRTSDVATILQDAAQVAVNRHLAAMGPQLMQDALALFAQSVAVPAPAPAPVAAPVPVAPPVAPPVATATVAGPVTS